MSKIAASFPEDDLPFMSISASTVFPGRYTLYLWEVAKVLSITTKHVGDLIDEGKLGAINISGEKVKPARKGTRTPNSIRRHWRIPVSAFEHFIRTNRSL